MISPKLRQLFEEERTAAWESAREKTAGPPPDAEMLRSQILSKYPAWMIRIVIFLACIVLAAAFLPSAFRLHEAGDASFCEILINKDLDRCSQVGASTVILAEIGQVIFVLCLAVLANNRAQKTVFWGGAGLSTLIALVGNAYVAEPWSHGGYIFKYLETFAPPLLVIGVGYSLKELFLYFVEERYRLDRDMKTAELERKIRYKEPEKDPSWLRNYSIALRDALRKANTRLKPELGQLNKDDWQQLIKNEMIASQWTVDPSQQTAAERIEADRIEKERIRQERMQAEIDRIRETLKEVPPDQQGEFLARQTIRLTDPAAAEQVVKELGPASIGPVDEQTEVWLNDAEAGTWTARSLSSQYTIGTEFKSEDEAIKRLKTYNYHWQRRQASKSE